MSVLLVSGLDEIMFAETELSLVDGEVGRLIMRGYDVETLSGRVSFHTALHLLWWGSLPTEKERLALNLRLGQKRLAVFPRLAALPNGPRQSMDFLRYALASLEMDTDDVWEQSLTLCAASAVATPAGFGARRGESCRRTLAGALSESTATSECGILYGRFA